MLQLYAMACGWLSIPRGALIEGGGRGPDPGSGALLPDRAPARARALRHGPGSDLPGGPDRVPGTLRGSLLGVEFSAGEEITKRLECVDVGPADVDWVVNSHLHFDHAGGNALLPDARVVVQRREWEAGQDPDGIEANGYKPVDYDLGHDVVQIDGEHDLFGDGSVVCIPTHGHTPGHQSLRLRLQGGDVVLAGDACYLRQTLEELKLPQGAHDPAAMLASLRRLRELEARGARIFYGHDPEFWENVPQAPAPVGIAPVRISWGRGPRSRR